MDLVTMVDSVIATIPGYVAREELLWLARWVNKYASGGYAVNVGVWKGLSLAVMSLARDNWKVVGVDTFDGSPELVAPQGLAHECMDNLDTVGAFPHVLPSCSIDAAQIFLTGDVGFLFLDAGHSYEDVMSDLVAWVPKLMSGGVLMVHDYMLPKGHPEDGFPGVARAVNEVCCGWYRVAVLVPNGAEWSSWIGVKP